MVGIVALSQFYGTGLIEGVNSYQDPTAVKWQLLGGNGTSNIFYRSAISKIVVDPMNPNIIYVAVATAKNGVTGHEGICASTNGGQTWTNTTANRHSRLQGVHVLRPGHGPEHQPKPSNQQVLYAAVGEPAGSAANGVYMTTVTGGRPGRR